MASTFSLYDRPTVLTLKKIKGRDGLNVIETIAANDEYRTFGMYLLHDENGKKIDLIENSQVNSPKKVVEGIVRDWLQKDPSSNYYHLIDCIRKSGMEAFAQEIEEIAAQGFRAAPMVQPPNHTTPAHPITDGGNFDHATIAEKPKYSITADKQPKPMAINSQEEFNAVKGYSEKVRVVIQTCNDAEYYAVLDLFEPPRIENSKFEKPVKYFHVDIRIVVGTFAGIDAAIVETGQGAECKEELQAAVEVFKSAKFLLGLGICYGIKDNSVGEDLKFADVLVSEEIGISKRPKLAPNGLNPRESFEKVEKVMKNIFCVRPMADYNGIVVSDEAEQRSAKVYVGRLLSSSLLMNDGSKLNLIKEEWRGYLGGEMEGWVQLEIPEVASIVIKGICDFADGKKDDKWQLTAAKAAVNYAHFRLKDAGLIDFNQL